MGSFGDWVLPMMVVGIVGFGLYKKINPFDCFVSGAKNGVKTLVDLMPTIIGLVVAVTMLTTSGGMDLIAAVFSPISNLLGVPDDVTPMALLSPISGGGSLTIFESILKTDGPDSFLGQVASVLMGSTDTTIYAVTVYFSAIGIKYTRHTLYAGLAADFASFVLSSFFVKLTIG
ncbi:MAG: spore maturation protein [Clostridia bacterium]